jgi:hypothetical protein
MPVSMLGEVEDFILTPTEQWSYETLKDRVWRIFMKRPSTSVKFTSTSWFPIKQERTNMVPPLIFEEVRHIGQLPSYFQARASEVVDNSSTTMSNVVISFPPSVCGLVAEHQQLPLEDEVTSIINPCGFDFLTRPKITVSVIYFGSRCVSNAHSERQLSMAHFHSLPSAPACYTFAQQVRLPLITFLKPSRLLPA